MTPTDAPPSATPVEDEVGPGPRRPRGAAKGDGLSDAHVGTVTGALTFVVLLALNWWVMAPGTIIGGDQAVQQLLGRQAVALRELRGIYSRVGFHHPGPSFAYLWGLGDAAARVLPFPGGPSTGALVANLAVVAAMVGATVAIVRSHGRSWAAGLLAINAVAVTTWPFDGVFGSIWIPLVTGVAFMLLLVAVSSAGAGRTSSLWAVAASAAFVLGAHVAMTTFVVGLFAVLFVACWATGAWRTHLVEHRRTTVAAAGLFLLMMVPTLLHTLTAWPGELDKYLKFATSGDGRRHGLSEAVRYSLQYWPTSRTSTEAAIAVVAFVALVAVAVWRRSAFAGVAVAALGTAEALLVYYAARGMDDLSFSYLGLFSVAVPGLVVGIALATAVAPWTPDASTWRSRATVAAVGAAAVCLFVLAPATKASDGTPRLDQAAEFLPQLRKAAKGSTVAVYSDSGRSLPFIWLPGLAVAAQDAGIDLCLTGPNWSLKSPVGLECTPAELSSGAKFLFEAPLAGQQQPFVLRRVARFPDRRR